MNTCKIPSGLNLLIYVAAVMATWGLLYIAAHSAWWWMLVAAWLFALVNNTMFSLLHEAVHGILFRNKIANDVVGTLAATSFPTSLSLQKAAHLNHHERNRTDGDMYDYYLPHQSKAMRNFWLYSGNLFGFYWFSVVLGNFIYLLAPWLYTSKWFLNGPARALGFEHYVDRIAQQSRLRIWSECLLAFAYQVTLFVVLDLSWQAWLLCYWAFALHWSALQYVDHAWSPRSIRNGAWNLKVLPVSRWLALNYHLHLAHHQYPTVPWIHLGKMPAPTTPQPGFWKIYFSLWKGVRPAPPMEDG